MESTSLEIEEDKKIDLEPANLICRGCLTTKSRMNSISALQTSFNDLTGITVSESDGLPQWLCFECSALLTKSVRFKRKMLQAHNILYQYLMRCAPFPIEANDEELLKYATPALSKTIILNCDTSGKGKIGSFKVLEHEKCPVNSALDDVDLPEKEKLEPDIVKEELGFSDYEDNITLEEFRANASKITPDDIEQLLKNSTETDKVPEPEPEVKKKKKVKKKEIKERKRKNNDESENTERKTSSIRKPLDLDPNKIRIVNLNPEEQAKQREEESRNGLHFPYQCNLCHKGFNFESKLQNHMSKHSPSRGSYECKLCQMYLPTSYSLNVHNLIHTRRYECIECGRRMIDRSSIIDHYRTQHEGLLTLYTCSECGKVSNNSKTHRGHMRNHHSGDRPKCDTCGKTFVNKDSLTEHMQIHQGIKNYECSVCHKRFRTRTQIKHHQLKHSDVKEFYCVECDVRFKSAHSLRQHLQKSLKHKDIETFIYSCTVCNKRFETSSSLQAHVRVQHEGVRAHVCATCGAALASSSSLAKHAHTVHAGRRAPPKHMCHTCGKAFRGKSVLTNHVRTHTGEKPFSCALCGRTFSQRTAMRTHLNLVHLKIRRQPKVKPETPAAEQPLPQSPKLEVLKPEAAQEAWRQPCDVYFQVSAFSTSAIP